MAQSVGKRVLTAALAVLFFTAFTAAVASAADTITVCPSGCDYTTIQAAVNAASPGDTVYVYSGTYTENVNVNKRITLQGEGADVVTVTAASERDAVFEVTSDYVNISGFTVENATCTGCDNAGIYLNGVNHCNISNNNASNNDDGILLYYSSDNMLYNNNASNNGVGIYLKSSSNNTLYNNNVNRNGWGINLHFFYLCNYNTLSNNNANWNGCGIHVSGSGNTLSNNNASNNNEGNGIILSSSSNCTLMNNTANSNYHGYGIKLEFSSYNTVTNNTASKYMMYGIHLYASSHNTLTSNTASNNEDGIQLEFSSNNNILTGNTANSNYGKGIRVDGSSYNTLTSNTANSNDEDGIALWSSNNNLIYNNYFSNTNNAYDNGNNRWNITKTAGTNIIGGPYLGGNYWSDYAGTDTDGDGLGDAPYDIPGGTNKDYLPLVFVVPKPSISIYTDTTSYTAGEKMHLGLDVKNPSDSAQKVSLDIYLETPIGRNYTLIDTTVTLPAKLNYSNPHFKVFALPGIPAGTYTWHAILDDLVTGEIICEDTAPWEFVSTRAPTEDIAEVLEQTTVGIDFGE